MLNDDDYDEAESSQSLTSKSKRQKMKKKQRRSRITINDAVENEIAKRQENFYDIDTKIKKSMQSAAMFNMSLNKSRNNTSKHFLKRKIKSAFEREPLEKSKQFFNVLFIPNVNMFNPTPTVPNFKPNIPQQLGSTSTSLTSKTPVISSNPVTNLIPTITKPVSEFKPVEKQSSIIQIGNLTNLTPEVVKKPEQSSSIIQINLGNNEIKPKPEEIPKKPEGNAQQKQIIKQLVERYFSNPEKLKSEMPPNDFLKLQNFIKKNLGQGQGVPAGGLTTTSSNNISIPQQPTGGDMNIQMLKNNLTGPSVSVSLNSGNNNPSQYKN
jgi:hypothetical protein